MNEPLEEAYFRWLCHKVIAVDAHTPTLTYWTLLRGLHNNEFVYLVSGDDNRAEDGLELRSIFLKQARLAPDPLWCSMPCSILEMLIAFSNTVEFDTDRPAKDWFWEFVANLGFAEANDASGVTDDEIGERLLELVWRTYESNGRGGLFPLSQPQHDQRSVEIWYQFCAYLLEHEQQ